MKKDDIEAILDAIYQAEPDEKKGITGCVRATVESWTDRITTSAEQKKIEARTRNAVAKLDGRRLVLEAALAAKEVQDEVKIQDFLGSVPQAVRERILAEDIQMEQLKGERQRLRSVRAGYIDQERQITGGTAYARIGGLLEAAPAEIPSNSPGVHAAYTDEEIDGAAMKILTSIGHLPAARQETELAEWRAQMQTHVPENVMAEMDQRVRTFRRLMT